MCYNASYNSRRAFEYAINRAVDAARKARLIEKFEEWLREQGSSILDDARYFTPANQFARFPAMILAEDDHPQLTKLGWSLVPRWCKSEADALKIRRGTYNARGETMFEKPAYRASAYDRRCVVFLDGFFEYHHQGKKRFPFYITEKHEDQMIVAGLYDRAVINGEEWLTFSMVTTIANETMARIHNNPDNPHRMPLILRPEQISSWLTPIEKGNKTDVDMLREMIQPYPDEDLNYFTVPQLLGKQGVGDSPRAHESHHYEDLELVIE